jgi:hypothetical protein
MELTMNEFIAMTTNASPMFWLTLIPLVLFVWFVPTLLALFLNRPHLKYIAIANIPAGMSFIAWGALIVWAFGGKVSQKFSKKFAGKLPETSDTPTKSVE